MAPLRERVVEVVFGVACAGSAVAAVCLTFDKPVLTAALVLAIGAVALRRWHEPADLGALFAALLLGPTLEFFATTTGLWTYLHTTFGTLPAWVFALWPFVPYTIRRLALAIAPPVRDDDPSPRDLALGLAVAAVEIAVLCLWGNASPVLATALTAAMLVPVVRLSRGAHGMALLVLVGVVGPLCEALPIAMGAWSYPQPFFLGQPMWLVTGYALFGFAVMRTGSGLVAAWQRRPVAVASAS